jgi:hypothetical protein
MNFTSEMKASLQSPIECLTLRYIAVYYVVSMFASVTLNTSVIVNILSYRQTAKLFSYLVVAQSALNLAASLIQFPVVIATHVECRWLFGSFGCKASAFTMFFAACLKLYLISFTLFERFVRLARLTDSFQNEAFRMISNLFV